MQILIVDDNAANRSLLRQMLSRCGYKTVEADSGSSAITIVQQHDIDIVLMDVMMPHMNGYEATRAIKQFAGNNHIPVIFVTALQGEEALSKALECGGDDYISKPINFDVIESKIRAHSRIRELTQQLLEKNDDLVAHNRRLQHEHELISYFFDNALARSYLDKRCIRHHFSSMAAFNGDLMLSRRSPCGGLYLLLGDFTGHGLTAAMGTLPVAQTFFELTSKGISVGDLAKRINTILNKLLPEDLFFAATIVEINDNGLQLDLWNGGMPSTVIASEDGQQLEPLSSQHMPLGILQENEFDARTIQYSLNKGDRLLLYTDGIIETKNPQDEEFGEQRLHSLFTESGDRLFDRIHSELSQFRDNPDQQDDMSVVEVLCDKLPKLGVSCPPKTPRSMQLPWQFSTTLNTDHIRTMNPVPDMVDTLDTALSLGNHKGLIYTILSEIYNNALNHSILGLKCDSKNDDEFQQYYNKRDHALANIQEAFIKFNIKFVPDNDTGTLLICLEDSGNAAPASPIDNEDEKKKSAATEAAHGRGLFILSELCKTIQIDNQAHRIKLQYLLD